VQHPDNNAFVLSSSDRNTDRNTAVPLAPTEDGDYLADDGTKIRVIEGKPYLLVQYYIPDTPPIFPNSPNSPDIAGHSEAASGQVLTQPYSSPPNTTPQIATPQNIVPIQDYRTATQVTQIFAGVPIPSYSAILSEQQANPLPFEQGLVTVTAPTTVVTVLPEGSGVETVPSLKYNDFSDSIAGRYVLLPESAGNMSSSIGHNVSSGTASIDNEISGVAGRSEVAPYSIWSLMAVQNNDLLLYPTK